MRKMKQNVLRIPWLDSPSSNDSGNGYIDDWGWGTERILGNPSNTTKISLISTKMHIQKS